MDRPNYFQTALSNFAMDAACGGAVRHLTDIGYTLDQIMDRLDYPASRSKVQQIMMEYLYESRVLLREEPSAGLLAGKEEFVQEQDAYGRRTMRRVTSDYNSQFKTTNVPDSTNMSQDGEIPGKQEILWRESLYNSKRDGKLTELLYKKCGENGEAFSFVSCAFGFLAVDRDGNYLQKGKESDREQTLKCLNNRQREYLKGIRWENRVMYHRLNQRMLEIVGKLYEKGAYSGVCFFVTKQEKLWIEP